MRESLLKRPGFNPSVERRSDDLCASSARRLRSGVLQKSGSGATARLPSAKAQACALAMLAVLFHGQSASAETLHGALTRAYQVNPTLNAQRAQVRAIDEAVPQAQAGYRPRIQVDADAGVERTRDRITKRDKEVSTEIEFDNGGDSQLGMPMRSPKKASNGKGENGKPACRENGKKQKGAFHGEGPEEGGAKPRKQKSAVDLAVNGLGGKKGCPDLDDEEQDEASDGGDNQADDENPRGVHRRTRFPSGVNLTVDQTLFDGFRTRNSIRQAESQVLGARELLRNIEQNVLLDAATAYMDVLRDRVLIEEQRNNTQLLEELLRIARVRLSAGDITPTDVAQAEGRLAVGRGQVNLAQTNLRASEARYRLVIGAEPKALAPGQPVPERLLPRTLPGGVGIALAEHPAIKAALHEVDAAELQVRIVAGELYPTATLNGSLQRRYDSEMAREKLTAPTPGDVILSPPPEDKLIEPGSTYTSASLTARVVVPIYEGGEVYARTRQAKETVGQQRNDAEAVRDEVRAAVATAWGVLEASKSQIEAAQTQVQAAEIALAGVRLEAEAGRRTTLDVLNAQRELLNARTNFTTAQRDRVVASFSLLSAVGRLSARSLGLRTPTYSPKQHFDQVKNLWGGVRTPDGR